MVCYKEGFSPCFAVSLPITGLTKSCSFWTLAARFSVALLELAFPLAVNKVVDDLLAGGRWDWIL